MNVVTAVLITITLIFSACAGDDSAPRGTQASDTDGEQGLNTFELEHGIGPITEPLDIGDEIDQDLVDRGREIFEMKCEMCHNMEGRMVGPELGKVMERRSPEFVMNMILNPSGMTKNHPEGQKLLQEYMTAMPFQNVKEEDARAIVDFLRDYNNN